jgi:hypothetical protein
MAVFWVVALCSLVEVYRRSRGACYFHNQGDESAASTSETFIRIHGATTQKIAIFIPCVSLSFDLCLMFLCKFLTFNVFAHTVLAVKIFFFLLSSRT